MSGFWAGFLLFVSLVLLLAVIVRAFKELFYWLRKLEQRVAGSQKGRRN